MAWVQRRDSHRLNKKMISLLNDLDINTNHTTSVSVAFQHSHQMEMGEFRRSEKISQRRYKWTQTHSFFAVMGGFAIDTSTFSKEYLPERRDRVVLSPEGLVLLAEEIPSLVPDIAAGMIKDKSKADSVTKTLVCIQAAWFIVQCTVRLQQGLSISLLELNTLVHALCALFIYLLWWNKPLDVEEPVLISDEHVHNLCAFMCFKSNLCFDSLPPSDEDEDSGRCSDRRRVRFIDNEQSKELLDNYAPGVDMSSYKLRKASLKKALSREALTSNQGRMQIDPNLLRIPGTAVSPISQDFKNYPSLLCYTAADRRRWNMAYFATLEYPRICDTLDKDINLVQDSAENLPTRFTFANLFKYFTEDITFMVAFTLAGFFNGGMHLAAWNAPFATSAQRLLWQISAISITSTGPAFLLILFMLHFGPNLCIALHSRFRLATTTTSGGALNTAFNTASTINLSGLLLFLFWVAMLLYPFGRFYLLAESLISLRYLPDSIFVQLNWSGYWPHIQ
jgi:hypothetical protein